jgi:hypothetical protein
MKYTKSLVALALIGSAFSLSACGGSNGAASGEAPSAAPVEKVTETPTPTGPAKSSRGNFIMKAGSKEFATQTDQLSDKEVAKFTVDSIKKGACTEQYAQPAKNGNVVFVQVTVQTLPALAEASFPTFMISAHDFKFIAKNGTTFNGSLAGMSYGCLPDAATFPSAGIGPDQKASGIIVLDVPQPSGTLLVKSDFGAGYEYTF